MLSKICSSRKRQKLPYWMYAGTVTANADWDKNGIIDVVDYTTNLIEINRKKNICPSSAIVYNKSAEGKHVCLLANSFLIF